MATTQWTTLTNGSLTATAGAYPLSLTDIDGTAIHVSGDANVGLPDVTGVSASSFYVGGGTTLTLPSLASYADPNPNGLDSTYLEATGPNAVLSLPALTSLGPLKDYLYFQAAQGGQVLAPALTTIASPTQAAPEYIEIDADGADSRS